MNHIKYLFLFVFFMPLPLSAADLSLAKECRLEWQRANGTVVRSEEQALRWYPERGRGQMGYGGRDSGAEVAEIEFQYWNDADFSRLVEPNISNQKIMIQLIRRPSEAGYSMEWSANQSTRSLASAPWRERRVIAPVVAEKNTIEAKNQADALGFSLVCRGEK